MLIKINYDENFSNNNHNLFYFINSYAFLFQTDTNEKVQIGPKNGHLVIVGGGRLDDTILKRFIDLAGGVDAPIVVIPTAGGREEYGINSASAGQMRKLGAKNITMLIQVISLQQILILLYRH